jgi:hypothetical protein
MTTTKTPIHGRIGDVYKAPGGELKVDVTISFLESKSLEIDLAELTDACAGLSDVSIKIEQSWGYYDETFVDVTAVGSRLADAAEIAKYQAAEDKKKTKKTLTFSPKKS